MALTKAHNRMIEGSIVNVKDYGAVCDGVTDDAAAVQAAIDAVVNYTGREVFIPSNCAIGSTINITGKAGIIIRGEYGMGFPFISGATARQQSLKWIGAAGGTMIQCTDTLEITLRDMAISGEDIADYGLVCSGTTSGWGLSNYTNLVIVGCNKNAMLKNATAGAGDFGRNHFHRCTFRISHVATGTAADDAAVCYNNDSGVQDVYEHCEFQALSGGVVVAGSYGLWIEAGTPRIHLSDCYTKAENGVYSKATGATPKFVIRDHYSEDTNFVSFANADTPQVLRNCVHPVGTGSSILWGGASGGGTPLIIDGGNYFGTITLANTNAPVIISNAPTFASLPAISEDKSKVWIGRSTGNPSTDTKGAINGGAFVPAVTAQSTTANININLANGTVHRHLLTANALLNAPTNIHATLDIGREIEIEITGDAGSAFTVTPNAIYKLAGGAYVHSGIAKIDILKFRWDGTNWLETSRSMNL